MFSLFKPANFVRRLTRMKADSESSFQARALARWDNEGGATKASERHYISQDEEHRHRAPMIDDGPDAFPMRQASPGSKSRELRARDDLYHQSIWKAQN
jgi:hypothetical protein